MPEYRRAFQPGGTFFFTLVTHGRQPILCNATARSCLREAIQEVRVQLPFEMTAVVLLPDHLHAIWKLPDGDADFSKRWGRIKKGFTDRWLAHGGAETTVSASRRRHRGRGVWQPRFWEHTLRDQADLIAHLDYIHYNPVKHDQASCPHAWPYSSFHRYVYMGRYATDWQCTCGGRTAVAPDFDSVKSTALE
ncbi:MAG: transposase [Phycisphaerae bacterium]